MLKHPDPWRRKLAAFLKDDLFVFTTFTAVGTAASGTFTITTQSQASYCQIGKLVLGYFDIAGTTSTTTLSIGITAPVTANSAAGSPSVGSGYIDATTVSAYGFLSTTTNLAYRRFDRVALTGAVGKNLSGIFFYEAA